MKKTVSNQDIAKAFRYVAVHVRRITEYPEFICHRLDDYACYDEAAAKAAKKIIRDRMGRPPSHLLRASFSLEDWLRMRGYAKVASAKTMNRYRACWLDALIKEFDGK